MRRRAPTKRRRRRRPTHRQRIVRWLKDRLDDEHDGLLLADGFEAAFVGCAQQFTRPPVAVYDRGECIKTLMIRDGMSYEGAEEFFQFKVEGAWVGERTPMFLVTMNQDPTEYA